MNVEDVLERVKKGESITWDDIRELSEEELKKVLLYVIKTDAGLQEILAGWLSTFYKAAALGLTMATTFGSVSQDLRRIIAIKMVDVNETTTLTKRELEVLELVAQGEPNKAIADKLYISEATVKAHLRRIFVELGAINRAHAVILAKERGLLYLSQIGSRYQCGRG